MNTNLPFLYDKKLFASTGKHDCASDIIDSNVAQSGLALGKKKKKRSSLQYFDFIFIQTFCCPRFSTVAKITTHCGGGGASWQSSWFIPHLQYKYKTEQATWGWLLQGPFSLINSSCKMITSKAIFVCKLHADALWSDEVIDRHVLPFGTYPRIRKDCLKD